MELPRFQLSKPSEWSRFAGPFEYASRREFAIGTASLKRLPIRSLTSPHNLVTSSSWRSRKRIPTLIKLASSHACPQTFHFHCTCVRRVPARPVPPRHDLTPVSRHRQRIRRQDEHLRRRRLATGAPSRSGRSGYANYPVQSVIHSSSVGKLRSGRGVAQRNSDFSVMSRRPRSGGPPHPAVLAAGRRHFRARYVRKSLSPHRRDGRPECARAESATTQMVAATPTMSLRYAPCWASNSRRASPT